MHRTVMAVLLAFVALSQIRAQNLPPVVTAGNDTTIGLETKFRMPGRVLDDGKPDGTLQYHWTKISGPDTGFTVVSPTLTTSTARVTGIGVYVFELWATDGEYVVTDSITITVREAIAFAVTTPTVGAVIPIGSSVLVTWQMDPISSVNINLSTNEGMTFGFLDGPVVAQGTHASWLWNVADTLPAGAVCQIQVQYYDEKSKIAVSGLFTLAPRSSVKHGIAGIPAGRGIAEDVEIFTVTGRRLEPRKTGVRNNAVGMRLLRRPASATVDIRPTVR